MLATRCTSRPCLSQRASRSPLAPHAPSLAQQTRLVAARAAAPPPSSQQQAVPSSLNFNNLLLTVLDANPYLSDGSKQAVATAALLATQYSSKLTVLVVDEPGTQGADPKKRLESISWHLQDKGCAQYEVVERSIQSPASVLMGDVADEIQADLVLLSSEAVHAKHVDANQLAEFVSCPVLLLP